MHISQFLKRVNRKLIANDVGYCGGLGCKNLVYTPKGRPAPAVLICPQCEARINQGIREAVHARTGRTEGNYHILEDIH